jgi:hypothetical protein
MLYRIIIVFLSEIHTKHKNAICGQNVLELFSVKYGGILCDYKALSAKVCGVEEMAGFMIEKASRI